MVENRAGLSATELRELEAILAPQRTLEDAVRWGLRSRPKRIVRNVVAHDEVTRDVVLPYTAGLFLVYETSGPGAVTRAAVWDREPTPEDLLAARLERGWVPTPTPTRDGPRILGFAARVADDGRSEGRRSVQLRERSRS